MMMPDKVAEMLQGMYRLDDAFSDLRMPAHNDPVLIIKLTFLF